MNGLNIDTLLQPIIQLFQRIYGYLSVYLETVIYFMHRAESVDLNRWLIIIFAVIFIASRFIKQNWIQQFNLLISFFPTLIHEFGHAFTAQSLGGKVHNIRMTITVKGRDETGTQGYATTTPRNHLANIITTFSGYASPPLVFLFGVWSIKNNMAVLLLLLLSFMIFFWLIHTSQKWLPIGILFIMIALGIDVSVDSFTTPVLTFMLNVILGLILGESVCAMYTTLVVNLRNQKWDGSQLRRLTLIPAIIWWFIWLSITYICLNHAYHIMF